MALTLLEYRASVRQLLRDDGYPETEIDDALNRVQQDVSTSGRFRFQEGTYTFNLAANTYTYAVPANCQAERLLIYDYGGNNEAEVPRRRKPWTGYPIFPQNNSSISAQECPTEWMRYGNNWFIFPVPVAVANMAMLLELSITPFLSPMDTTIIPDRHSNVLVYGATSQLRPGLIVGSPEGQMTIEQLYERAMRNLMDQEHWDFASIPKLRVGVRWNNLSQFGNVTRIRG